VNCVKRRSVLNDPIGTTERSRGVVVRLNVLVDLDETDPRCDAPVVDAPAPTAPARK
jgi:hypothetical protein